MPVIERASETDIPALSELLSVLFTQENEFSPDPEAQRRGLSQIIHNPGAGAILVLREGNTILGMVTLLFTVSTALGERVALLEDMVVSPKARGVGAGSALLSRAISFAKAEGCKRITLLTDGDNRLAQRFYEKYGFTASSMIPFRLFLLGA
jgi:ribosomal protein S18 acetylase RimI-like enzyme